MLVRISLPTFLLDTISLPGNIRSKPLALLLVIHLGKCDRFPLVQTLEAVLVDIRKVNKNIFSTIIWTDETVSLITEEFAGTGFFGAVLVRVAHSHYSRRS